MAKNLSRVSGIFCGYTEIFDSKMQSSHQIGKQIQAKNKKSQARATQWEIADGLIVSFMYGSETWHPKFDHTVRNSILTPVKTFNIYTCKYQSLN